jgi:hypothetical protein
MSNGSASVTIPDWVCLMVLSHYYTRLGAYHCLIASLINGLIDASMWYVTSFGTSDG